ncbi:hypothetical protein Emtol_3009 [Emticicia oligotrophica DSM 17448]|uniref:Uncharacterized protein n=1 Tax=Emticicia oligotrophica (strain DSM 17448 / CIP 109782 / MTCC 6937 / GPTSA100-15) TaxID=929562 RepID=A0ABN4AP05_EMTOG|nr:hypothetical protein Emtol_3009 [Emticicia oligotrophica DSM 17448]
MRDLFIMTQVCEILYYSNYQRYLLINRLWGKYNLKYQYLHLYNSIRVLFSIKENNFFERINKRQPIKWFFVDFEDSS